MQSRSRLSRERETAPGWSARPGIMVFRRTATPPTAASSRASEKSGPPSSTRRGSTARTTDAQRLVRLRRRGRFHENVPRSTRRSATGRGPSTYIVTSPGERGRGQGGDSNRRRPDRSPTRFGGTRSRSTPRPRELLVYDAGRVMQGCTLPPGSNRVSPMRRSSPNSPSGANNSTNRDGWGCGMQELPAVEAGGPPANDKLGSSEDTWDGERQGGQEHRLLDNAPQCPTGFESSTRGPVMSQPRISG